MTIQTVQECFCKK